MTTRKTIAGLVAAACVGVMIGAVGTYAIVTSSGLQILSFAADRQDVLIGDRVTFTWDTRDATEVAFRFVHLPTGGHGDLWETVYPAVVSGNQPSSGQWSYTVPIDLVDRSFRFEIEARDEAGNKVATRSDVITVSYWACFVGTVDCVMPPTQVVAMFQPFQHGAMLWREDTATVYVLADGEAGPPYFILGWRAFADTWAADQSFGLGEPPAGLTQPHGRFSKIMAQYPDLLTQLGWATAPETLFDATIQQTRITCGAYCSPVLYIRLEDGRTVQLAASQPALEQGYVWSMLPAA